MNDFLFDLKLHDYTSIVLYFFIICEAMPAIYEKYPTPQKPELL